MRPFNENALTERIFRVLATGAKMTPMQIKAALGLPRAAPVTSALHHLELRRRVEQCGEVVLVGQRMSPVWRARQPEAA